MSRWRPHPPLVGCVVAAVEEGILVQADVHERRLHAGEDVGNDALVDVADDGATARPLDVQLGELVAILHGETGLRHADVHDDPLGHGSSRRVRP
jgi:hypothetical protein